MSEVEAAVREEVEALTPENGTSSVRTKTADGLFDKVHRMVASGRPAYEVGDVIDAVGARITVNSMEHLGSVLSTIQQRFGTGEHGRILEVENMYADPKRKNPAYRVIPMVVRIDVNGAAYTYELQLTTHRASVAADLEHNTLFKQYHDLTPGQRQLIARMFSEAAALDQEESRR
nr:hypothetical protein [Kineosporia babensis]